MNDIPVSRRRIQIGFKGLINRTDESILDPSYAKAAYNFTIKNGALTADMGIDKAARYSIGDSSVRHEYPPLDSARKIINVFPYCRRENGAYDDRIAVFLDDGRYWYTSIFNEDVWHTLPNVKVSGNLSAVNYNFNGDDVLLISSESTFLTIINGEYVTECDNAPKFSSIAIHNERVYGSVNGNRNQVWFSDDFNPTNWIVSTQGAGFINFDDEGGDIIKVMSFLNYLYVFREHGVYRLTAYGDQNEFSLKKVFTDTGYIYKPTIAMCGDRIMFLAEEGLFSFDGYDMTRIAQEIPKIIHKETACGAYHNNCYYLACALEETDGINVDGMINNALVRYDVRDKDYAVFAPCDLREIRAINVHNAQDLLCVFRNENANVLGMLSAGGTLLGQHTDKLYISAHNVLGTDRLKTVRDFTVETEYPLTVCVVADGEEFEYTLEGSKLAQKVFVGKSGRKIGFKLKANGGAAYVSPLIVNIDLHN